MKDLLLWNKISRIVMLLAECLDISPVRALDIFYNRENCQFEGGNLAASKIRNLECPSYEICLIDYGCGKFNRKIHIMEQYP